MRVVIDPNVLISAILFDGLPRAILRRALRGSFGVVTSPALMAELEEILAERFGIEAATARGIRAELELLAEVFDPQDVPRIARDRDDDAVLAVAVVGGAEAIVTGDRDLLALGDHRGIRIVTPRQLEDLRVT